MSAQIRLERKAYYGVLETSQKGDLDITAWLEWFLECLGRAIDGAEQTLAGIVQKARFWETFKDHPLNDRQRKVVNRLLDGVDGRMTSSRWATLTKTSPDTALRDINDLVRRGILVREQGGGRSTSYGLTSID